MHATDTVPGMPVWYFDEIGLSSGTLLCQVTTEYDTYQIRKDNGMIIVRGIEHMHTSKADAIASLGLVDSPEPGLFEQLGDICAPCEKLREAWRQT